MPAALNETLTQIQKLYFLLESALFNSLEAIRTSSWPYECLIKNQLFMYEYQLMLILGKKNPSIGPKYRPADQSVDL